MVERMNKTELELLQLNKRRTNNDTQRTSTTTQRHL